MSYIGNTATTQGFIPAIDYFSGNGSTVAFTLSRPVASVAQVQANISNVPQNPSSAFSVSGNTITFTSAPPSGSNNIYVYYTSPITQVIAPSQGTVSTTSLAGGTVSTTADITSNGLTVGRGAGAVSTNTAVGASALEANTSGANNTAVGQVALDANTTGSLNVAFGVNTLGLNTTGSENSAIGVSSLSANTTGSYNTALGRSALGSNTTANNNTAVGYQALYANTTATGNNAIGYTALYSNTTGTANTAEGVNALYSNTTGGSNTSVGYQSLLNATTADNNTAVGYRAGYSVTTGYENICIGKNAGFSDGAISGGANLTTGGDNIYIGYYAVPSASNVTTELVIGASGSGTVGKGINTGFIKGGSGGIYQGNNSSSWSVTSDRRLKKNIVDFTAGLEKLLQLQVRNFEYRLPEEVEELNPTCAIEREGVQIGVIAQEIQQVLPDCVKQESTGVLSVDSDNLTWYLVKAIQEQQAIITSLTDRITALEGAK
jgi:hypothetical protein